MCRSMTQSAMIDITNRMNRLQSPPPPGPPGPPTPSPPSEQIGDQVPHLPITNTCTLAWNGGMAMHNRVLGPQITQLNRMIKSDTLI